MNESCQEKSFLRTIYLTAQATKSFADNCLKDFDLTIEQMQVLKKISLELGLTQSKLSEETVKSPANMTRILDRMEKKQIIIRKRNPVDRRSSLVFLTEEGQKLREEVTTLFRGVDATVLEGIPLESQNIALTVLEEINRNIENIARK